MALIEDIDLQSALCYTLPNCPVMDSYPVLTTFEGTL